MRPTKLFKQALTEAATVNEALYKALSTPPSGLELRGGAGSVRAGIAGLKDGDGFRVTYASNAFNGLIGVDLSPTHGDVQITLSWPALRVGVDVALKVAEAHHELAKHLAPFDGKAIAVK